MRQKPSLRSILIQHISQAGSVSNAYSKRAFPVCPRRFTAVWSVAGRVEAFTDGWVRAGRRRVRGNCTSADRFRIILSRRFSWGTTATRDTLSSGERSARSSRSVSIRTKPASTWYWISSHNRAAPLSVRALTCGPVAMACSMTSSGQGSPQLVGVPEVANFARHW